MFGTEITHMEFSHHRRIKCGLYVLPQYQGLAVQADLKFNDIS